MQKITIAELVKEAKLAGQTNTDRVHETLSDEFDEWLDESLTDKNISNEEVTDEELNILIKAFEEGFSSRLPQKVTKDTLLSWSERLENLRRCMLEPEKCTHEGGIDYAAADSCLDQIVSEIEDCLK